MKIAFLFAGQGAQAVGMGKDFYDTYPLAKVIYDNYPEIKDLCFNGPVETLNQTAYAQKAMLLTSYTIASILKSNGITPEYACGLSLGEYSALAYANTWKLDEAIEIITNRGKIMQDALPLGTSKMAAVIGLDRDIILNNIKIYKGIITENYVANELKSNVLDLLYWKGNRDFEIDFLITMNDDGIIPIEVKADNHT